MNEITVTIASNETHSIWNFVGPFDTVHFAYGKTSKNTAAKALADALFSIPLRGFMNGVHGSHPPVGAKLPVTVIATHEISTADNNALMRKIQESFDLTWQIVPEDDIRITEMRDWLVTRS